MCFVNQENAVQRLKSPAVSGSRTRREFASALVYRRSVVVVSAYPDFPIALGRPFCAGARAVERLSTRLVIKG